MTNSKERMDSTERKTEVLNMFLDTLIAKGVSDTTVRDLSASINLQSAGMYYYYQTKEELIVACAEEAALRLEDNLISPALHDIEKPHQLITKLLLRAEEMAPTMKFLIQVCATPKYEHLIKPAIDRLSERYVFYSKKFADKLNCRVDDVSPYMYMCITAITNFMVFDTKEYIEPQMVIIENALNRLLQAKKKGCES